MGAKALPIARPPANAAPHLSDFIGASWPLHSPVFGLPHGGRAHAPYGPQAFGDGLGLRPPGGGLAAWLWGIVALGAHATAAQGSAPDGAGPYERAAVSCPAAPEPGKEGAGSAATAADVCRPGWRPHTGTSRQPGLGLAGAHARETVDRIPEKPRSGRSSRNRPSTRSGRSTPLGLRVRERYSGPP